MHRLHFYYLKGVLRRSRAFFWSTIGGILHTRHAFVTPYVQFQCLLPDALRRYGQRAKPGIPANSTLIFTITCETITAPAQPRLGGTATATTPPPKQRPSFHELQTGSTPGTEPFAAPPNASSIFGLTVAGYQGWFATPNDDDNNGWVHWGPLKDGTGIMEDFWPVKHTV